MTLIEATSKKVNFCQHIIGVLRLKNIRVIHGRAEEPATMKVVGKMDVVISRATLKLPTFIKAGCPYLKPHGLMIAMLGSGWADEIDRAIGHIKRAGLNIVKIHEYILPVSQSQRALVIFEKK